MYDHLLYTPVVHCNLYAGSNIDVSSCQNAGKDGDADNAAAVGGAVGGAVAVLLVLTVIVHVLVVLFKKQLTRKLVQKR